MRTHISPDVLSAVRHAYQMASYMEAKGSELVTTGVLAHDGSVLILKEVYGMEQALLLRDMLEPFGFVEYKPGPGEPDFGCRMLLKLKEPPAAPKVGKMLSGEERWPKGSPTERQRTRTEPPRTGQPSRANAAGGPKKRHRSGNDTPDPVR